MKIWDVALWLRTRTICKEDKNVIPLILWFNIRIIFEWFALRYQNYGKNLNANFLWMVGLLVCFDNRYLIDKMKTKVVPTFSFSTNWCCEIIKKYLDDVLFQSRFEIRISIWNTFIYSCNLRVNKYINYKKRRCTTWGEIWIILEQKSSPALTV